MANKFHRKSLGKSGGPKRKPAASIPDLKMATANWPSAAGKTQSKDRSGGITKKGSLGSFHVKQEGL